MAGAVFNGLQAGQGVAPAQQRVQIVMDPELRALIVRLQQAALRGVDQAAVAAVPVLQTGVASVAAAGSRCVGGAINAEVAGTCPTAAPVIAPIVDAACGAAAVSVQRAARPAIERCVDASAAAARGCLEDLLNRC